MVHKGGGGLRHGHSLKKMGFGHGHEPKKGLLGTGKPRKLLRTGLVKGGGGGRGVQSQILKKIDQNIFS